MEENATKKRITDETKRLEYMLNGGDVTLKTLRTLSRETQQDILDYLRDCPLYEAVTAANKDYILDCGVAYGNEPTLLRLNDYKEFRL